MKIIFWVAQFLIIVTTSVAQEHDMNGMSHTIEPIAKNVYLVMMDTMMARMETTPEGHSPEEKFLLQMIPHHMGAIDMAKYEVANGKNFEMVQLAKSILAEQESELTTMQLWLKKPLNSSSIDTSFSRSMDLAMSNMMLGLHTDRNFNSIDKSFAIVMIPHHQAAVDMAKAVLAFSKSADTMSFAKMLISNEQIEILQMSTYIK